MNKTWSGEILMVFKLDGFSHEMGVFFIPFWLSPWWVSTVCVFAGNNKKNDFRHIDSCRFTCVQIQWQQTLRQAIDRWNHRRVKRSQCEILRFMSAMLKVAFWKSCVWMLRKFHKFHFRANVSHLAFFFCSLVCHAVWFIQYNLGKEWRSKTTLISKLRNNILMQLLVKITTGLHLCVCICC